MATSIEAACSAGAKPVIKVISAQHQQEGAGFLVRRAVGGEGFSVEESDPFILLDELPRIEYTLGEHPGAPWHPRLGLLTACYIKEGQYAFDSSTGGKGTVVAGCCQWVHAGAGVQVSEGHRHPGGLLHGFQCFINLPRQQKKDTPYVQMTAAKKVACADGVSASVLAGECQGVTADFTPMPPLAMHVMDFTALPDRGFEHVLPEGMTTVILYVYKGAFAIGPQAVKLAEGEACLLWHGGSSVWFRNTGASEGGLMLLAGVPLKEPMHRCGPVVLNSRAEVKQALLHLQGAPAGRS